MLARLKPSGLLAVGIVLGFAPVCLTQENSGGGPNWTRSSQQQDPRGTLNPLRIHETHTEADGRVAYVKLIETLGPDGKYVLYSEVEKESVRIDATTVRDIERAFGRGPKGQKVLIQERREESRSFPDGEKKVLRTTLGPDANGALEVVQRELQDSKQLGPDERVTKTTLLTPDVNGGLTPAVQIEEQEKENGAGAIAFKRSTSLSDGAGHWHLAEVREGSRSKAKTNNEGSTEERVLRPDSNNKLAIVERTVGKQSEAEPEGKHGTIETYSSSVPGRAGTDSLQLVQRETIRDNIAAGTQSTRRQIERPNPGNPGDGLQVAQETIDIVRPTASSVTEQNRTFLTRDSDGRLGEVWIDTIKTDNTFATTESIRAPDKPE